MSPWQVCGVKQGAQTGHQTHGRQPPSQHSGDDSLAWWQGRHLGRQKQPTSQALQGTARQRPRVGAVQHILAMGGRQGAGQYLQQCGFARPRGANHGHLLASGKVHIQRLQCRCCIRSAGRVACADTQKFKFQPVIPSGLKQAGAACSCLQAFVVVRCGGNVASGAVEFEDLSVCWVSRV